MFIDNSAGRHNATFTDTTALNNRRANSHPYITPYAHKLRIVTLIFDKGIFRDLMIVIAQINVGAKNTMLTNSNALQSNDGNIIIERTAFFNDYLCAMFGMNSSIFAKMDIRANMDFRAAMRVYLVVIR